MGLLYLMGASSDPNPRSLFASNEPGVVFDTQEALNRGWMWQDVNGVTPVTAPGDPISLQLDTSRGGLDALGSDLVTNGTFDADASWTKGANWTIGSGVATKTGGAANNLTQTISSTAGLWYRCTATVTRTAGTLTISLGTSGTSFAVSASGTYTFFLLAGSSTQTLAFAGDSSFAGTVDAVTARLVPGTHRYQSTSGSRPTLQTVSGKYAIQYDGVDDSFVTASINFSGTDKMTVMSAVRKLSDAARGIVAELTSSAATNNGAFHLSAPNSATTTIAFGSKGTTQVTAQYSNAAVAAPVTAVTTGIGDISGDIARLRVNGTQVAEDLSDQGTGNYSNAVLYFGRRGNSTLPYNGYEFCTIIRGATTADGVIRDFERNLLGRRAGISF